MKQYCVEILEKNSHGKYGKLFFFGWYLQADTKKEATELAYDMLSRMSIEELSREFADPVRGSRWYEFVKYYFSEGPIGIENAERMFTVKAYIE